MAVGGRLLIDWLLALAAKDEASPEQANAERALLSLLRSRASLIPLPHLLKAWPSIILPTPEEYTGLVLLFLVPERVTMLRRLSCGHVNPFQGLSWLQPRLDGCRLVGEVVDCKQVNSSLGASPA